MYTYVYVLYKAYMYNVRRMHDFLKINNYREEGSWVKGTQIKS